MHFIQLTTIVADVFKIEPTVQEQTYYANTSKEERAPKEAVEWIILSLSNNLSNYGRSNSHTGVLDRSTEPESSADRFFIYNVRNWTP